MILSNFLSFPGAIQSSFHQSIFLLRCRWMKMRLQGESIAKKGMEKIQKWVPSSSWTEGERGLPGFCPEGAGSQV